jgi:cobalt/nickel transport system permease protein
MTAILLVQALVFQDGGVLALAANVFNMALAGVWVAWWAWRALAKAGHARLGVGLGAFLSVTLSAGLALAQVIASGAEISGGLLWFCAGLFAVTGVVEALITIAAWEAIERLEGRVAERKSLVAPLLAVAGAVMLAGVFFASQSPDVLEVFSERAGAAGRAKELFSAWMPDYEWKAVPVEWLGKALAGVAGLGILYALSWLLVRLLPGKAQE